MGYRENVQKECSRLGVTNPLQEKEILVEKVQFFLQGQVTEIIATDMNRAGRFFFQIFVDRPEFVSNTKVECKNLDYLRAKASDFFAENWDDAEESGRKMLIAFKNADGITIFWR